MFKVISYIMAQLNTMNDAKKIIRAVKFSQRDQSFGINVISCLIQLDDAMICLK